MPLSLFYDEYQNLISLFVLHVETFCPSLCINSNQVSKCLYYVTLSWAVHGSEYSYGAHDHPSSGVFEVEPKNCPGFIYRCTVFIGRTTLNPLEFRDFIQRMASEYHGDTYHLISKNCNHFTDDLSTRLTGKPIPGWVNRLARLGNKTCATSKLLSLKVSCDCLTPRSISHLSLWCVHCCTINNAQGKLIHKFYL